MPVLCVEMSCEYHVCRSEHGDRRVAPFGDPCGNEECGTYSE